MPAVEPNTLVVVLSRESLTGLSIVRSLGQAGFDVDYVSSEPVEGHSKIVASSKYVRKTTELVRKQARTLSLDGTIHDDDLLAALMAYATDQHERRFLFPVGDDAVAFMDANKKTLGTLFSMPHLGVAAPFDFLHAMDKEVQGDLAAAAGLAVPRQWRISLRDDSPVIPKDIEYPVFVKPATSISGWKIEMARCDDRSHLKKHLLWLRKSQADRDVLVQGFLDIDEEICLSGVCFGDQVIIPAVVRKLRVGTHAKGATITGQLAPTSVLGDALAKVEALMRSFCFFGMFDMELHVVGDVAYFGEVNLRAGGPNYAYLLGGANVPAACVSGVLAGAGETPREVADADAAFGPLDVDPGYFDRTFVVDNVAWDEYISNHISKSELKHVIGTADDRLLCRDDDAAPGRLYSDHMQEVSLEKKIKRKVKKGLFDFHIIKS